MVPKRRKIAYSFSLSVRLSNVGVHIPQIISKKGRCKVFSKKELKLDLLASVLIATSIFAATLQKTALLSIIRESYCWK